MKVTEAPQALQDVRKERELQDEHWGEQNHDPFTWIAILSEELGEFSKEALTVRFHPKDGSLDSLRGEAIQVAAVALAIVECLDRNKWTWPATG